MTTHWRVLLLVVLVMALADLGVVAYIRSDPGSAPEVVGAVVAVLGAEAALLGQLNRWLKDKQLPVAPPGWQWLWHPLLFVAPALAGVVGLTLATRQVDPWLSGVQVGAKIALGVYVAGVVAALLHHLITSWVEE